jgi:predicted ATP-grasp superfamily ATP-dependent carboligase
MIGSVRALILDHRGALASLAAARALAADRWKVGIGAPRPDGLAAASNRVVAFHVVPAPEDGLEAFAAGVRRAVESGGYELVFASSDVDVLALSAVREQVGAAVPYPEHTALHRAMDKLELTAAARRAGLAVPRTVVDEGDELELPVVVKERVHGDLAAGASAATTMPEIVGERDTVRERVAAIRARRGEPIVQEVVRGQLLGLNVVCDREHRIVARVQHEALTIWPGDAGMSARAQTVRVDEQLAAGAQRLLRDLGWFGLVQLQFLAPRGETPRLIDLNGRFYLSLALALAAGVNLPALWARLATERPLPDGREARAGVRFQWLEGDLRRAREEPPGAARWAAELAVLRWSPRAHHSIWSADDPRPAARALAALVRERRAR